MISIGLYCCLHVCSGSLFIYVSVYFLFLASCSAPSQVIAIRQENASQNSVTLLWHEPDQPNGVILEYDVKYYEKVQ